MPSDPSQASQVSQIAAQLVELGVRPGGALLVHSSLRSLGPVDGGAETVVRGLLAALGPSGTLLMPALSYAAVTPAYAHFDALRTPACVGALAEYFRARPATLRSVHPTHSVCALGPLAASLLAGHELDATPCGPRSPFARLPQVQGQVLFLGCGLAPNTSLHAIEEQVEPPYLYGPPVTYTVRFADGRQGCMTVRAHAFQGYAQRYERIAGLLSSPAICEGFVLRASCHLLEARALWDAALPALRRDPFYFVESIA